MIFQFYHIPFVCLLLMVTASAAPSQNSKSTETSHVSIPETSSQSELIDIPDVLIEEPENHKRIVRSPAKKQDLPDLGSSRNEDLTAPYSSTKNSEISHVSIPETSSESELVVPRDVFIEEYESNRRIARSPAKKQDLPDLGSSKNEDNKKNGNKKNWKVKPNIGRDEDGNTSGKVRVEHEKDNQKFHANYEKVFHGPGKKSETWNIGGEFEW